MIVKPTIPTVTDEELAAVHEQLNAVILRQRRQQTKTNRTGRHGSN